MHQKKITSLAFAVLVLFSTPLLSQANDIALPAFRQDLKLASIDPNRSSLSGDASGALFDLTEDADVLDIEEVDVWARLRSGFGIPDLTENPLVASQLSWYSARPDYILRTTNRASRYLFHVVHELEVRDMPAELALLPFIESAFNPQALSTAKAAGMWQFMPLTGRDFNLKQTMFKDERRGVLASTNAALDYLQKLYRMFGDWQLALAAYNWGEGSVQRAIKKNQAAGLPIDFNSLSHLMPAETRNYVPKLQAVKTIIANPQHYGITLPKVDNQPYFVTIGKTHDIDLKVAAQLAELSIDEFKALNPQFNRPVITGSNKTQILLPQENAEKFKANLGHWKRPFSSWTTHTVNKRERIESIAKLFQTTPELIREVNHIPPKMLVKAGSTLLVPKSANSQDKDISPEIYNNAMMSMERDRPSTNHINIKVRKHDNLASLAKRHRVSVAQIRKWNGLKHHKIVAGESLQIQVPLRLAKLKKKSKLTAGKKTRSSKKTMVAQTRKNVS